MRLSLTGSSWKNIKFDFWMVWHHCTPYIPNVHLSITVKSIPFTLNTFNVRLKALHDNSQYRYICLAKSIFKHKGAL